MLQSLTVLVLRVRCFGHVTPHCSCFVQVLKLRLALRAAGLSNVNVGSVEDFQVREALLSFVMYNSKCTLLKHKNLRALSCELC
jgi:hypothetical protein